MAGIVYLFSAEALFEVVLKDEGRDMWRLHLARREYAAALEHCQSNQQRDKVRARGRVVVGGGRGYEGVGFQAKKYTHDEHFAARKLIFQRLPLLQPVRRTLLVALNVPAMKSNALVRAMPVWCVVNPAY